MQILDRSHAFAVQCAIGWLELGNVAEAKAELSRLDPSVATHPHVLEAGWLIHVREENWAAALSVARALVQSAPQLACGWLHQAYALRRVPEGGLSAAREALMPAFEWFPQEPTIPYNLACYACQLGQLDEARKWLHEALGRAKKEAIKAMALSDPDLEPLWKEIRKL